jgi:hypothetical protein
MPQTPPRHPPLRALIAVFALMAAAPLAAESVAPFVPTDQEDVEAMLELADVGPSDYLIDLGSGDGRIVITAAFRGAMGHGVELDGALVDVSLARARDAGVADVVTFQQGDIFAADLRHASVVTLYLMPEVNLRLRPRLLEQLRPGSRVVSNSFDMGEWRADVHAPSRSSGGILIWVVPAAVAGYWTVSIGDERLDLAIAQQFQDINVSLARGSAQHHVLQMALRGDRISFLTGEGADRFAFSGRVTGSRMHGVVQIHGQQDAETRVVEWQATRR